MGNGERGIVRWGEKFFSLTSRTSTDAFAAHPLDFWGTRVKRKTVAKMVFISRKVREVFAAEPRSLKLSWRQIADAIIVAEASFGLRLKSRRKASSTSAYGF